jgi:hypothetical protein
MWAALLTVVALSLLISSALAAVATYLYFIASGDTAQKGFPAIRRRAKLGEHCVRCGSVALPKPGCGSHCRGRFGGVLDRSSVSVFCARLARWRKAQAVLSEPNNCG